MTAKKKTTARTTGLTGNQFASVEQGRSYVLSVNSPTGAGEIELLAADSDQQSESDMFSMLYEKIETARQIPFVAISPFVFVNVGSSDVQWLVTPANFSIAVPGASSGGGSSFDPASDQNISGDWTFSGLLKSASQDPITNESVLNAGMADNRYMTLDTEQTVQGKKNFEGNIKIRTISSDITDKEPTKKLTIWTFLCNKGNMVIYQYTTTSLVGIQSPDSGGGFNVAKNGNVTCENSLLVRGGTTINSLDVSGPAEFDNTVTVTAGNKFISSIISQEDLTDTTIAPTGTNDQRYIKYLSMTEAEYKALQTKSTSTIYYLTDKSMWAIGDKEIVTSDMPA
nr:MAG TPA: hypothetical protein [Caudoviricetes sp.]